MTTICLAEKTLLMVVVALLLHSVLADGYMMRPGDEKSYRTGSRFFRYEKAQEVLGDRRHTENEMKNVRSGFLHANSSKNKKKVSESNFSASLLELIKNIECDTYHLPSSRRGVILLKRRGSSSSKLSRHSDPPYLDVLRNVMCK